MAIPAPTETEEVEGKLSIVRTTSNARDDYITVELHLEGEVTKAEISLADFAYAVTGMSLVPVKVRKRLLWIGGA